MIKIDRSDKRRRAVDRYNRKTGEFDSKYLLRTVYLRLFGIPIYCWFEDVRPIAVHEWSIAAFGETPVYKDEL